MIGKIPFSVVFISTLVEIQVVWVMSQELPVQHGVQFVGIGYNILEGNPEGGDLTTGGVDPGLLVSRRIFQFTFDQGHKTADQLNRIPDEVAFVRRSSAFQKSSLTTFYGTESYASKLAAQVEVGGGYKGATASVQFAASARYQDVKKKTSGKGSVFLSKESISNFGEARYRTELLRTGNHLLTTGFVADACLLPETYTEETQQQYMEFMDDWGTHVVIRVSLGMKEGEHYEENRSSFVNFAATNVGGSISASGAYMGFSASLSVDMESFNSDMNSDTQFGKTGSSYRIGSETLNEPISIELIAMPEIFESEYWTGLDNYISKEHCTSSFNPAKVKENMDKALLGFAKWREIDNSTNPSIRIPLTWPDGKYGLPRPYNGCPSRDWEKGSRLQVGLPNNENIFNIIDTNMYFAGWVWTDTSRQEFCIKTVPEIQGSRWQWQPGSYCIYRYGSGCPQGFTSSYIDWNYGDGVHLVDEGVVPAGTQTKQEFCCRADNAASQAIYLPTDSNFMLLTVYDTCQQVNGMSVKKVWLYLATDQTTEHEPQDGGPGPMVDTDIVTLNFCYYYTDSDDIVFSNEKKDTRIKVEAQKLLNANVNAAMG
ncbi:uncharacterized protein LOC129261943 [Lytechinus pictus]|uniref:uncharacterized protein LOC129261943 n=1 Tax=Lytechinus pictus TaxID=7653 RepID=UPI0030B9C562